MLPAPDPTRTVAMFGRRIPVGDFRPWFRLLVMGGMLTAVGLAARSLSRQIVAENIQDRLAALSEVDERVTLTWNPLFPMDGFPSAWTPPPVGMALACQALVGRVLDERHRPLAGAIVKIPGRSCFADERGDFTLDGVPANGRVTVRVDPPDKRGDLAPLFVNSLTPGIPGQRASLGVLVCVVKEPSHVVPDFQSPAADDPTLYKSIARFVNGENFADWRPASSPEAAEEFGHGSWYRTLESGSDGWRVSAVGCEPSQLTRGEILPSAALEVEVDLPSPVNPMTAEIWVDVMASGQCIRGEPVASSSPPRFRFPRLPAGDHRIVASAENCLPTCAEFSLPLPGNAPRVRLAVEEGASVEAIFEGIPPTERRAWALRVDAPSLRTALVALPDTGSLLLTSLPAESLRFELVRSCSLLTHPILVSPPFERTGQVITRTLAAGRMNARIVFHAEKFAEDGQAPKPIAVKGLTRAGAHVYRLGARADEPASWVRADDAGRFSLAAPRGSRIFAARGEWPLLTPFAAGVAENEARFAESVKLVVGLEDTPKHGPSAELTLRLTGEEAFGRNERTQRVDGQPEISFDDLPPNVPYLVELRDVGLIAAFGARTPAKGSARIALRSNGSQ